MTKPYEIKVHHAIHSLYRDKFAVITLDKGCHLTAAHIIDEFCNDHEIQWIEITFAKDPTISICFSRRRFAAVCDWDGGTVAALSLDRKGEKPAHSDE